MPGDSRLKHRAGQQKLLMPGQKIIIRYAANQAKPSSIASLVGFSYTSAKRSMDD
jgi:hypothetical protein